MKVFYWVSGVVFFSIIIFSPTKWSPIHWNTVTDFVGLVTAIIAVIGLYLQGRLLQQEQENSKQRLGQEQDSFRQQLIAVLHHAEGITDSLFALENTLKLKNDDPMLTAAVESSRRNASALQMGLMESKVGGKQLSDDLDKAYKEWAETELKLRVLPLKQLISDIDSGKHILGTPAK